MLEMLQCIPKQILRHLPAVSKTWREDAPDALTGAGIRVHFGGVRAVDGVDLRLRRGEILGLIGPNGAGKTTLLNALSGFQRLHAGTVKLGVADIGGLPPYRLARMGLARTFQGVRLFPELSVLRNVEVSGLAVGLSRREARRRAWSALERVELAHRAEFLASALPLGEERRVSLARATATAPKFLLLDEPAAGLSEVEIEGLMKTVDRLRVEEECGVMLIEHDMTVVMGLCERIQVLDAGKTICVGVPEEVQADERVVAAYLGAGGS